MASRSRVGRLCRAAVAVVLVASVACSSDHSSTPATSGATTTTGGTSVLTASYDGTNLTVLRVAPDDGGPVSPVPAADGVAALAWELDAADGSKLARGTVVDATYATAEFADDGSASPFTARGAMLLELRVPTTAGAEGTLHVTSTTSSGIAPQDLCPTPPCSVGSSAPVPVSPTTVASIVPTKLVDNGACAPFNLLFVAEGYAAADMPTFEANVKQVASALGGFKGFSGKTQDFNLWVLEVPSNASGITDPGCTAPAAAGMDDCNYMPPPPAVVRDSAFAASYGDNVKTPRRAITLGTPTTALAKAAATALASAKRAARADITAFLVNDPGAAPSGQGGAANIAGKSFTASNYSDYFVTFVATTAHETGHALFGLQDEYSYGATAAQCASGNSNGAGPLPLVNVTDTPSTPPWAALLTTSVVPTPGNSDGVGAFPGAYYCPSNFYRAQADCLMRSTVGDTSNSHGDFCAVCLDHVTKVISTREQYAACACKQAAPSGSSGGAPLVCPSPSALVSQATAAGWWPFN